MFEYSPQRVNSIFTLAVPWAKNEQKNRSSLEKEWFGHLNKG
jgi:hypothetical protein